MAGNKYNAPLMGYKPEIVEIRYTGRYDEQHTFKGDVGQCIRHLIKLTT